MRQFVESLARLYKDERISKEKIMDLHSKKLLTDSETKFILGE